MKMVETTTGHPQVSASVTQQDLSCPAKESSGRVRKWVLGTENNATGLGIMLMLER